ncbi:MAG: hypothetical protein ACKOCH_03090, partial [Bacteroidota bacterium]
SIPGAGKKASGSDNVFEYLIPAGVTLTPGEYTVRFLAGSWKDSEDQTAVAASAKFVAAGASVELAGPSAGERFDRRKLNQGGRLAVRFLPTTGATVDTSTITDAAAEFTLAGPGVGTAVISGTPIPDTADSRLYYFPITGSFTTGAVEVRFVEGAFSDSSKSENAASV